LIGLIARSKARGRRLPVAPLAGAAAWVMSPCVAPLPMPRRATGGAPRHQDASRIKRDLRAGISFFTGWAKAIGARRYGRYLRSRLRGFGDHNRVSLTSGRTSKLETRTAWNAGMDLLDLIRNQINALPTGTHLPDLRSGLHHIETAYKHFARGQSDESAFTDTIYRTNQAFEGSVKEAYRVLADKDPTKLRPYDIEQYLEEKRVFRDRILWQFTNYRTAWRNPATHDYNLNFDEAEAFLAIVSVSAFTKLLVDEIAERLNYVAVQKDVAIQGTSQASSLTSSEPLIALVTSALLSFPKYYEESHNSIPIESEAQLMGALAGFLASVLPSAHTSTGRVLHTTKAHYIDMMITAADQSVIVELKRGDSPSLVERGVEQLSVYLAAANAQYGVLFLYSDKSVEYDVTIWKQPLEETEVYVLRPAFQTNPSLQT
jgi:hypothetical protein